MPLALALSYAKRAERETEKVDVKFAYYTDLTLT